MRGLRFVQMELDDITVVCYLDILEVLRFKQLRIYLAGNDLETNLMRYLGAHMQTNSVKDVPFQTSVSICVGIQIGNGKKNMNGCS